MVGNRDTNGIPESRSKETSISVPLDTTLPCDPPPWRHSQSSYFNDVLLKGPRRLETKVLMIRGSKTCSADPNPYGQPFNVVSSANGSKWETSAYTVSRSSWR